MHRVIYIILKIFLAERRRVWFMEFLYKNLKLQNVRLKPAAGR